MDGVEKLRIKRGVLHVSGRCKRSDRVRRENGCSQDQREIRILKRTNQYREVGQINSFVRKQFITLERVCVSPLRESVILESIVTDISLVDSFTELTPGP